MRVCVCVCMCVCVCVCECVCVCVCVCCFLIQLSEPSDEAGIITQPIFQTHTFHQSPNIYATNMCQTPRLASWTPILLELTRHQNGETKDHKVEFNRKPSLELESLYCKSHILPMARSCILLRIKIEAGTRRSPEKKLICLLCPSESYSDCRTRGSPPFASDWRAATLPKPRHE